MTRESNKIRIVMSQCDLCGLVLREEKGEDDYGYPEGWFQICEITDDEEIEKDICKECAVKYKIDEIMKMQLVVENT